MELKIAFGRVIRQRRIDIGLTQEQLGFDADLRRTYISIIELGQQQPSLSSIFKLAWALRILPSQLLGLVEKELGTENFHVPK